MRIVSPVLLISLILSACSMGPVKQFPEPQSYQFEFKQPDALKIVTTSGHDTAAPRTRMMAAGGIFMVVPTGPSAPQGGHIRSLYGKNLQDILSHHKVFSSIQYVGDESIVQPQGNYLDVHFLETYVGEDGWPLELKAEYTLYESGVEVFRETYEGSASLFDLGCGNCLPYAVAFDELNKQFFPDLERIYLERRQ